MSEAAFVSYSLSSKRFGSYTRTKQRLYVSQEGKCHWCGKICAFKGDGGRPNEFTVDHIIPLSHRGTNHWMNTVGSCQACNNKRYRQWIRFKMVDLPDREEIPVGTCTLGEMLSV